MRGAATSAAARAGVTMTDIMQAADWSAESVFRRFHYQPSHDVSYGRTVLSSTTASGETWPFVIGCVWLQEIGSTSLMISYKQHHWYVRLSLLKYNCQVVQITKWLHAIWDYMKKVKSSISMVPPTRAQPNGFANSKVGGVKTWWPFIEWFCACELWHMARTRKINTTNSWK